MVVLVVVLLVEVLVTDVDGAGDEPSQKTTPDGMVPCEMVVVFVAVVAVVWLGLAENCVDLLLGASVDKFTAALVSGEGVVVLVVVAAAVDAETSFVKWFKELWAEIKL